MRATTYLSVIGLALVNLGFSLIPQPVAWVNAIVFFGCTMVLMAMVGWDICEIVAGAASDEE